MHYCGLGQNVRSSFSIRCYKHCVCVYVCVCVCVAIVTNKDLLHVTRNSIQYSVNDLYEKRLKKRGYMYMYNSGFPGGSVVKNPSANSGDTGLILGSGRSPGEEMTIHSSILAWQVPWTEEPGRLQSMGPQRVEHDLGTKQHN